MRKRLCALIAVLAFGIAPIFTATIAHADSMEEVTVAHRGATTSKLGEGTLAAYQYAVRTGRTCWMAIFVGRRMVPMQTKSEPW